MVGDDFQSVVVAVFGNRDMVSEVDHNEIALPQSNIATVQIIRHHHVIVGSHLLPQAKFDVVCPHATVINHRSEIVVLRTREVDLHESNAKRTIHGGIACTRERIEILAVHILVLFALRVVEKHLHAVRGEHLEIVAVDIIHIPARDLRTRQNRCLDSSNRRAVCNPSFVSPTIDCATIGGLDDPTNHLTRRRCDSCLCCECLTLIRSECFDAGIEHLEPELARIVHFRIVVKERSLASIIIGSGILPDIVNLDLSKNRMIVGASGGETRVLLALAHVQDPYLLTRYTKHAMAITESINGMMLLEDSLFSVSMSLIPRFSYILCSSPSSAIGSSPTGFRPPFVYSHCLRSCSRMRSSSSTARSSCFRCFLTCLSISRARAESSSNDIRFSSSG